MSEHSPQDDAPSQWPPRTTAVLVGFGGVVALLAAGPPALVLIFIAPGVVVLCGFGVYGLLTIAGAETVPIPPDW